MTNPTIRFIRRGQTVTLVNVPPTRTLLEVLREDIGAAGTKEGCGEGDCGACTVVTAEAVDGRLRYTAVNSCIRLAHAVDGLALWTAEDLAADPLISGGGPHPVQQAMADCHASQCGFCTPGFAMSLFALYQSPRQPGEVPSREDAQAALSGNLCRCTGYRPLLDAAEAMVRLPPVRVDDTELLLKLKQLKTIPRWETADFPQNPSYMLPHDLRELLALHAAHPQAQLVAGCTDVGLWITKQHQDFAQVLDTSRVEELRLVEQLPGVTRIGAAVTLTDAFTALEADRPALRAFARRFAGLPVRNAGTLGGNVANGSPIGDSMPLLIALDARVTLASVRGTRTLALEALYTGYRRNVIAADEVLSRIDVPRPPAPGGEHAPRELLRVYKVSKRFEDDISAICLAVRLVIGDGRITHAAIGVGGVAATPVRAVRTGQTLVGHVLDTDTLARATETLRGEFTPISDLRASAGYRRELLGNLLRRFWLEAAGQTNVSLDTLSLEDLA